MPDPTKQRRPSPAEATDAAIDLSSFPPAGRVRWTASRKAALIAAIDSGTLSAADTCQRYYLSDEELETWRENFRRAGIAGLQAGRVRAARRR